MLTVVSVPATRPPAVVHPPAERVRHAGRVYRLWTRQGEWFFKAADRPSLEPAEGPLPSRGHALRAIVRFGD